MSKKAIAYIGLGSNLGDRESYINSAIERIGQTLGLKVVKKSTIYETEPVGGPPQGKYLNAVMEVECELKPRELLDALMAIENDLGRNRTGKNHPRTIDLDILLIDDIILDTPQLTIPHPRLTEREFVLRPLAEIAPDLKHPVTGLTVAEHLLQIECGSQKSEIGNREKEPFP